MQLNEKLNNLWVLNMNVAQLIRIVLRKKPGLPSTHWAMGFFLGKQSLIVLALER